MYSCSELVFPPSPSPCILPQIVVVCLTFTPPFFPPSLFLPHSPPSLALVPPSLPLPHSPPSLSSLVLLPRSLLSLTSPPCLALLPLSLPFPLSSLTSLFILPDVVIRKPFHVSSHKRTVISLSHKKLQIPVRILRVLHTLFGGGGGREVERGRGRGEEGREVREGGE